MKALKTAIAVALTMTLCAGYSFAQGQGIGVRCQQHFAALDTDKDGNVTLSEFLSVDHPRGEDQAKATFEAKDTDKDGNLTQAEFCPGA